MMLKDTMMAMTHQPQHRAVSPLMRDTMKLAAIAAVLGTMLGLAPLGLSDAHGGQANHLRVGANAYGGTQRVELGLNKSLILDLPGDVREVIVSQPSVAGAIMRSKRRAIVQGSSAGDTNIFFLDAAGEAISVLEVSVTGDTSGLSGTLAQLLPGSSIQIQNFGDRLVLSGYAQSQDDVAKAISIAAQFTGSVDTVTSVIDVTGSQQVMLKVTVAEVTREAVKQLGINLNMSVAAGALSTQLISTQALGGASNVITTNGVNANLTAGPVALAASLRALERRSALRTLAEPTLTALSGQEAEFLAGGEFPVPSGVDDQGRVTFTFKEFGARLLFTPTVRSNGIIGLVVDTSVSEPTTEGGFTAGGVTIPATKERQARTSVELGNGQTLVIGGLMQDSVRQQINKLPGLGDIPILGALFRSRDFIHSKTELVILVTPYLAYPGPAPVLPTDEFVVAGDAEAIFLGRMEAMYGVGPDGMRGSYDGSVGFVLD
jgi:pilus assembly protein CpaC